MKTKVFQMRLSETEIAKLHTSALNEGISTSEYVRRKLFGGSDGPRVVDNRSDNIVRRVLRSWGI